MWSDIGSVESAESDHGVGCMGSVCRVLSGAAAVQGI